MARLNIEDHAFGDPRLYVFAEIMGWNRNEAFGSLAFLWHESQRQRVNEATTKQIMIYMGSNSKNLVDALDEANFIESTGDGLWRIKGNKDQIAGLERFIAKQRINGTKGGRPKKKDETQTEGAETQTEPTTSPKKLNFNSNYKFNSKDKEENSNSLPDEMANAIVGENKKMIDKDKRAKNVKTWELYSTKFAAKYNTSPLRDVTVNAQISKLTQRIPEGDMEGVLDTFLGDNDFYVVKQRHPIGLLLKQAEGYYAKFKARAATVVAVQTESDSFPDEYFWEREDELDYRGCPVHLRDKMKTDRIARRRKEGWRATK